MNNIEFTEKISPYLVRVMDKVESEYGVDSLEYNALYRQYKYTDLESLDTQECNDKHYEAGIVKEGFPTQIERLYRRQVVVEITMVCAANCRYCLRSNYNEKQIRQKELDKIVEYCASEPQLKEILITGGEPLLVPQLLKYFIAEIAEKAKNIKIIRIGTRLPVHDPTRMNESLYSFFDSYRSLLDIEIAIQINHAIELQKEAREVLKKLKDSGATIYSQNVLLKGINNDVDALVELYDNLRYLGIEAHYLFHAVPIKRTGHFRTTIKEGLELIKSLTSSGNISGRIKPMYSLMTDVGKVTLYEDTLADKDEKGYYEVKTRYKLEDRLKWNPYYKLPESAYVDDDGYIRVKYLDGGQ